ncbi:putative pilus assambly protein [uncultured Stenotrophomonas sp.]|uniref:Type II secretion system protein H n=1 Tax=uncultured Stenotrophomonas sp. TaxID=165438 RepID=A0A1Y5Q7G0_9GAMM|nr:putative pilus assambly protein [uncultured Stenotrophomonas sp.]
MQWMKSGTGHARGFSLLELMVTVAVLAILMAIAVPGFSALINRDRLTSQANELVALVQYARSEAIRLNGRVRLCPSSDGAACAGGDWSRVIVLSLRDNAVLRQFSGNGKAAITADVNDVTFSADGLARDGAGLLAVANVTVCIDTTRPPDNQRVVQLASGSRVSIQQASGACP